MEELRPCAHDISDVQVENKTTGDFRSITLTWRRLGREQSATFRGMAAHRVHGDLCACSAISKAAEAAYLMGLCRMFGIVNEKLNAGALTAVGP